MLLLSYKAGEIVMPIGLLQDLDMNNEDDFGKIEDHAIAQFKDDLRSLRPDTNWDSCMVVIKIINPQTFTLTIKPFDNKPASRKYYMTELDILNPKHPIPLLRK